MSEDSRDLATARRYRPSILKTRREDIPAGVKLQSAALRESRQQEIVARNAALIHKGHDETIDLSGSLYNPQFVLNTSQILVTFTMPTGLVGYIDKVAVIYSEPIIAQCGVWNWGITVNGALVANTGDITTNWRTSGMGEIVAPLLLSPIWIQSNETVALEVYSTIGLIYLTESYTIEGRISGRIYKPASPLLKDGF